MASMRDIKRRKDSIASTGQITKAMKLVSTVKLQKARTKAEESKPYFHAMYQTVLSLIRRAGNLSSIYLTQREEGKKAFLVITSNRGLAGGYNANVAKMITREYSPEDCLIYPVGRKGRDILRRYEYQEPEDYSEVMNAPLFSDAVAMGSELLEKYQTGEIREINLVYTVFKNTVTQIPTIQKLLPIDPEEMEGETEEEALSLMNFEPEPEEALELIIPKYLNSLIYGALVESFASENGARMQAMDNATNNAEEMIDSLTLKYNRARQASITQEITEIVAGAAAINE